MADLQTRNRSSCILIGHTLISVVKSPLAKLFTTRREGGFADEYPRGSRRFYRIGFRPCCPCSPLHPCTLAPLHPCTLASLHPCTLVRSPALCTQCTVHSSPTLSSDEDLRVQESQRARPPAGGDEPAPAAALRDHQPGTHKLVLEKGSCVSPT